MITAEAIQPIIKGINRNEKQKILEWLQDELDEPKQVNNEYRAAALKAIRSAAKFNKKR